MTTNRINLAPSRTFGHPVQRCGAALLTSQQTKVFLSVKKLITLCGVAPTIEELSTACSLSKTRVREHLATLEKKGVLIRRAGKFRSIEVIQKKNEPSRDRFVLWVQKMGRSRLARELGARRTTVAAWTNSEAKRPIPPAPSYANKIVELSKAHPLPDGPLTIEDIYDGTTGLRGQTRSVEVPPPAPQITAGASANA